MNRVEFTDQAATDLEALLDNLAAHSIAASERVAADIDDRCRLLAQFPRTGRDRSEFGEGLRSVPVGRQLVFFRPVEGGVRIVRILYGGRDLTPEMFDEDSPLA